MTRGKCPSCTQFMRTVCHAHNKQRLASTDWSFNRHKIFLWGKNVLNVIQVNFSHERDVIYHWTQMAGHEILIGEILTLQAAHHTLAWREATKLKNRNVYKTQTGWECVSFSGPIQTHRVIQINEARDTKNHQINVTYFGYILLSGNGHNLRQIHEKSITTINGVTIMLLNY